MAHLVPLVEVLDAIGKPNAGWIYQAIKGMKVKKILVGGRTYVSREDAIRIAERLA